MEKISNTLRNAPLFRLAIPFVIGVFGADSLSFSASVACVALAFVGYAWLLWWSHRNIKPYTEKLSSVSMYLLMAGIGTLTWHVHHFTTISYIIPNQTQTRVVGVAITDAKPTAKGNQKCLIQLVSAQHAQGAVATEEVIQAYFAKQTISPKAFDTVYAVVSLQAIQTENAGFAAYLRRNGISRWAYVRTATLGNPEASIEAYAARAQKAVGAQFASIIPDKTIAGIALAMFVGDTHHLDRDLRADFATAGLSHILAISGMHVGIVYLLLTVLMNALRLPITNRMKYGIILLLLVAYMLLTGASPSVVRAVVMFGTLLVAKMLYWQTRTLNLLGLSALLQIIVSPDVLFHVGFQLSYAAVAGIVLFYPLLTNLTHTPFTGINHVFSWMNLTLAAQVFTAPIIIATFGTFPTYFLISNITIAVVATATTFVGFCALMLCYVPAVNVVLGWLTFVLLRAMSGIALLFAHLPNASVQHFSLLDSGMQLLLLQCLFIGLLTYGIVWGSRRYALTQNIALG